ncbi:hypothetical protein AAVH_12126 [Aphelenchoides avenae]|nr:hypothetical protein AAVH_12126 [Aphelenchus avenae]
MAKKRDADIAVIVNYLHARMRHAYVEFFIVHGRIPAEGFEIFLNLPSLGPLHSLTLRDPSFWQLESGLIHRFAFHFETLDVFRLDNGTYSKSQISGLFLRECAARNVLEVELQSVYIVSDEVFDVSEDDICEFLFGKPATLKQRRLSLNRVHVSENFLQRLVQESQRSTITEDISLGVSPAPRQNYHDYAANLKQAEFGMLVNFPGDIRLQFTVIGETLHMRRGDGRKREERFFFVAEE